MDPVYADIGVDIAREVIVLDERLGEQFAAYAGKNVNGGRCRIEFAIGNGEVHIALPEVRTQREVLGLTPTGIETPIKSIAAVETPCFEIGTSRETFARVGVESGSDT